MRGCGYGDTNPSRRGGVRNSNSYGTMTITIIYDNQQPKSRGRGGGLGGETPIFTKM